MRGGLRCVVFRVFALLLFFSSADLAAQGGPVSRPEEPAPGITVAPIAGTVVVDGSWSAEEWRGVPAVSLPYEVLPRANFPAAHRTECRIGYDAERLLVTCRAWEDDPESLRAFRSDRDEVGDQDHMGFFLDPVGDARRAFRFSVSAAGVQSDGLYDARTRSEEDWDAIWEAAAARTDDGYVVEVAVPFRSLRFPPPSPDREWRVFFFRYRPRTTLVSYRSFHLDTGNACLLCQASLASSPLGITAGRNVEVTPTVSGRRTDTREPFPEGPLSRGDAEAEFGVSGRWGVTPDLSLSTTVNPDFSQVEADAVQIEANTQFALFVPEKRPFFLEGTDLFQTPIQALLTRTMTDPSGGAKVSGKLGATAVGAMVVRDEVTNLLIPGPAGSSTARLGGENTAIVGRLRREFSGGSSAGLLYAGRLGSEYENQVVGIDVFFRPLRALDTQLQVVGSRTAYPETTLGGAALPSGTLTGGGARLDWYFYNRQWESRGFATSIGEDLRLDLGFEPRVGYSQYEGWGRRIWWGDPGDWYSRADITLGYTEAFTDGDVAAHRQLFGRVAVEGPWQTYLWLNPRYHREAVDGRWFTTPQIWWWFGTTPNRHLDLRLRYAHGEAVDYVNTRAADYRESLATLGVRLGRGLQLQIEHATRHLANGGEAVLDAEVIQGRAIYNLSTRTRLRVTAQYQETERHAATNPEGIVHLRRGTLLQTLVSYRVDPQTAIFVGYGDQGLNEPAGIDRDLSTAARNFFVKLSYAWRP